MPTIWGQKTGDGMILPYKMFQPTMEEIPLGTRLRVKIEEDRNGKFNALYHVMLDLVAKAINRGPAHTSKDDLKKWVKLQTGRYDLVPLDAPLKTLDGRTVEHSIEYHSTSFEDMGEGDFHQFAMDTCALIQDKLAPWISDSPEWGEIMQILSTILPEGA